MERVTDITTGILEAFAWALGETLVIYFGIPLIIGIIITLILKRILGRRVGKIAGKFVYLAVIVYIFLNGIEAFNYLIENYESRVGIS